MQLTWSSWIIPDLFRSADECYAEMLCLDISIGMHLPYDGLDTSEYSSTVQSVFRMNDRIELMFQNHLVY